MYTVYFFILVGTNSFFISLMCSLFSIHMNIYLLTPQPLQEGESRNPLSYFGIHRTSHPHFCFRWVTLSNQPFSPFRCSIIDDFGKTLSRVLDQAYQVTCCPLDEILNFLNLSFFRMLAFFKTYLFMPWFHFLQCYKKIIST